MDTGIIRDTFHFVMDTNTRDSAITCLVCGAVAGFILGNLFSKWFFRLITFLASAIRNRSAEKRIAEKERIAEEQKRAEEEQFHRFTKESARLGLHYTDNDLIADDAGKGYCPVCFENHIISPFTTTRAKKRLYCTKCGFVFDPDR